MITPRQCGSCYECCTQIEVKPLGKPAGSACQHCVPSNVGCCAIYDSKPSCCSTFACSWFEGHLWDDMKPETSGIVFETLRVGEPVRYVVIIGKSFGDVSSDLQINFQRYAVANRIVVGVSTPDDLLLFGPPHHVQDFLMVLQSDKLVVHMADGELEMNRK